MKIKIPDPLPIQKIQHPTQINSTRPESKKTKNNLNLFGANPLATRFSGFRPSPPLRSKCKAFARNAPRPSNRG